MIHQSQHHLQAVTGFIRIPLNNLDCSASASCSWQEQNLKVFETWEPSMKLLLLLTWKICDSCSTELNTKQWYWTSQQTGLCSVTFLMFNAIILININIFCKKAIHVTCPSITLTPTSFTISLPVSTEKNSNWMLLFHSIVCIEKASQHVLDCALTDQQKLQCLSHVVPLKPWIKV